MSRKIHENLEVENVIGLLESQPSDPIDWTPELVAVLHQAGYSPEKIMEEIRGGRGKILATLLHDLRKLQQA